jgi:DNA polymerase-3 subunit delta'
MLIGHQKIWDRLSILTQNPEMPATFLFSGPEGVGKMLFAKEWAKKILCLGGTCPQTDCTSCAIFLESGRKHPDLIILSNTNEGTSVSSKANGNDDESQTIKIDRARAFMIELSNAPLVSNRRVAIVDSAHLLTNQAANSLLKTLEEPPPGTIIILVTHLPDHLPQTIRSRCLNVSFGPLSLSEFKAVMEQVGLKTEMAQEDLYDLASGAPGQAESQSLPSRVRSIEASKRLFSGKKKPAASLFSDLSVILDDPDDSFFLNRLESHLLELYRQEDRSPHQQPAIDPIKRQLLHDKLLEIRTLSAYNIHRAMNAEEVLLEFREIFGA